MGTSGKSEKPLLKKNERKAIQFLQKVFIINLYIWKDHQFNQAAYRL